MELVVVIFGSATGTLLCVLGCATVLKHMALHQKEALLDIPLTTSRRRRIAYMPL